MDNREANCAGHPPACTCVDCIKKRLDKIDYHKSKLKIPKHYDQEEQIVKRYHIFQHTEIVGKTFKALGWLLFSIGTLGFILNLFYYSPIREHLQSWSISSVLCVLLVWLGWGFSHHFPKYIWHNYFSGALRLLLVMGCVTAILYTGYALFRHSITLEMGIAIAVVVLVSLWLLNWIVIHKIATILLLLPLTIGVITTIFPKQTEVFLTGLGIYSGIGALVGAIIFLNPLNALFFLCGIAFIVWVVVSIVRGV